MTALSEVRCRWRPVIDKPRQRCAKCGSCTVVCPVFRASGGKEFYSARGKKHLLEVSEDDRPTPVFEDIFSKCLLCGACVEVCPRAVDITLEVRDARAAFSPFYGEHGYKKYLARKVLEQNGLLSVVRRFGRSLPAALTDRLPRDSGLRLQLAMFEPAGAIQPGTATSSGETARQTGRPMVFFPGCSARYLYPEIIESCTVLFRSLGYDLVVPEGLKCCGMAMDASGDRQSSIKLAKKNILALERVEGQILVTCGSCYSQLIRYRDILANEPGWSDRVDYVVERLVEMCRFLDDQLPKASVSAHPASGSLKLKVFYHDPCHFRNELKITREPRNVLARYEMITQLELEDGSQCCGQGGLFHLGAPQLSAAIRDDLATKVLAMQPDVITTTCSGCLMQWKQAVAAAGADVVVEHLAELLRRIAKQHG